MEVGERSQLDILGCIQLEKFQKGQVVLRQGERGDKFYIIIEGTVGVYINNEEKAAAVREYQMMGAEEQQDLLEELTSAREASQVGAAPARPPSASRLDPSPSPQFSPRISLPSPRGGVAAFSKAGQGAERFKTSAGGDRAGSISASGGQGASLQPSSQTLQLPDGAKPQLQTPGQAQVLTQTVVLTEVKRLSQGDAFGELALLRPGSTRQATIICATDCRLAALTRAEYGRTLANA